MDTPEKIRWLRKAYGLTQTKVAEKIGVTRQTLMNYERGLTIPNQMKLSGIADCFGLSVEELMSEETDEYIEFSCTKEFKKYKLLDGKERYLLFMFDKLDKAEQRELIDMTQYKTEHG